MLPDDTTRATRTDKRLLLPTKAVGEQRAAAAAALCLSGRFLVFLLFSSYPLNTLQNSTNFEHLVQDRQDLNDAKWIE